MKTIRIADATLCREQNAFSFKEKIEIARQLEKLDADKNAYCDTYACGITFCGLALVGLPGEPFNEIGKQVRKNSKFPVTCVLCQSNGAVGYIPTAEAHDQGGYEAYNTPYVRGTAEQMADTADELLKTLSIDRQDFLIVAVTLGIVFATVVIQRAYIKAQRR